MLKILMLSKTTVILTTFVNNTDNVHVDYHVFFSFLFFFFFVKAVYTAVKIQ